MNNRLGQWLSKAMFERGGRKYSQAALARDLHVQPMTVSDWLTGKRPPDRANITLLARHFGTTSRYLYELLGQEPPEDLNDVLEKVDALTYGLSQDDLIKLLKRLEGK